MNADDQVAALRAEVSDLHDVVIRLRMQLAQLENVHVALIEREVEAKLSAAMRGRELSHDEYEWVRAACKSAAHAAATKRDVLNHTLKWGVGSTLGFLAWSAWEAFKHEVKK